jgi:hypothetical protein
MAVGYHAANLANKILDHFRGGTSWTQPSGIYVQLHTGDPGSAGTANLSANTTRVRVNFAAASAGAIALTGTAPTMDRQRHRNHLPPQLLGRHHRRQRGLLLTTRHTPQRRLR